MSYLLAVDPSLTSSGVAFFCNGQLVGTYRARVRSTDDVMAARCMTMANVITEWLDMQSFDQIPALVFEWPQVYRASRSKGDPNQLLPLVGIGCALAGMLQVAPVAYTPAEWAGQLPKATKGDVSASPRARRIHERLSPAELVHWVPQHDTIDAIGLGLFHLQRLQPKRVYPGAT